MKYNCIAGKFALVLVLVGLSLTACSSSNSALAQASQEAATRAATTPTPTVLEGILDVGENSVYNSSNAQLLYDGDWAYLTVPNNALAWDGKRVVVTGNIPYLDRGIYFKPSSVTLAFPEDSLVLKDSATLVELATANYEFIGAGEVSKLHEDAPENREFRLFQSFGDPPDYTPIVDPLHVLDELDLTWLVVLRGRETNKGWLVCSGWGYRDVPNDVQYVEPEKCFPE